MTSRTSSFLCFILSFVLAFASALLSVLVQSEGPELASYGNMCWPTANEGCYQPVLKGGFPLPYLLDMPGVSVEHQLAFGEDTLHRVNLVLDIAIHWSTILFLIWFVSRRLNAVKHNDRHGDASHLKS